MPYKIKKERENRIDKRNEKRIEKEMKDDTLRASRVAWQVVIQTYRSKRRVQVQA